MLCVSKVQDRVANLIEKAGTNVSRMHSPAHPGEVLREWLPEGMPVAEASTQLGVSRNALSQINVKTSLPA